jgi:hypothetical protein
MIDIRFLMHVFNMGVWFYMNFCGIQSVTRTVLMQVKHGSIKYFLLIGHVMTNSAQVLENVNDATSFLDRNIAHFKHQQFTSILSEPAHTYMFNILHGRTVLDIHYKILKSL